MVYKIVGEPGGYININNQTRRVIIKSPNPSWTSERQQKKKEKVNFGGQKKNYRVQCNRDDELRMKAGLRVVLTCESTRLSK